jgi:hypothetical protein
VVDKNEKPVDGGIGSAEVVVVVLVVVEEAEQVLCVATNSGSLLLDAGEGLCFGFWKGPCFAFPGVRKSLLLLADRQVPKV